MTTIITYGTFDMFHIGHVNLLKHLSELGDRVIVGCSTDDFNSRKGKKSIIPYEQRVEVLLSCRYVDEVFPENDWSQKIADVQKYAVDIFGMGNDWAGKFDFLGEYCKVIYLPRTDNISSTDVRKIVNSMHHENIGRVLRAAKDVVKLIESL